MDALQFKPDDDYDYDDDDQADKDDTDGETIDPYSDPNAPDTTQLRCGLIILPDGSEVDEDTGEILDDPEDDEEEDDDEYE